MFTTPIHPATCHIVAGQKVAATRARMNDEERQDRLRQLFKNGSNAVAEKTAAAVCLKGVRLNCRFELMMAYRNKSNRK